MADHPTAEPAAPQSTAPAPAPAQAAPPASSAAHPEKPKVKAATGKKGKKGKKSSEPEILWTVRLSLFFQRMRTQSVEVLKGLTSKDRATRRMSFLFFCSLTGLIVVATLGSQRLIAMRREAAKHAVRADGSKEHVEDFLRKQHANHNERMSFMDLGTFVVKLKSLPGAVSGPGVMGVAEVTIVLECDSVETHDFLEGNLAKARNQIIGVFIGITREELMSREGKRKIKKTILEKINSWLPSGKVEDAFFSKLILS